MRQKIIRNSAKCKHCGDEIESKYVHDFVSCRCGSVSVDGGKQYLRRAATKPDIYEDTSIVQDLPE
jgi:hypothetical protein